MNRQMNNVPFNPSAVPKRAAPVFKQQSAGRVPLNFIEAMKHISVKLADNSNIRTPDVAEKTPPARQCAAQPSAVKWKSSFKPIGEQVETSQDNRTSSPERDELYNPYDPASSDSEHETPHGQDRKQPPPDQDKSVGCHNKRRWDSCYSDPVGRTPDRSDFSPETTPTKTRALSPGPRLSEHQAYSPDRESRLDHRVHSPDRTIHGSSTQRFPAPYGAQRCNGEERITMPEYRREISPLRQRATTAVRLSPPRLQRDFQLGYMEAGLEKVTPSTKATRNRSQNIFMDKTPIICDLCDVELANGQELQDHLETKGHWDTLEHIQQENNYDDLAIAFLQEVLLYKSRQCSRAIEDNVLQALQENDYMTKIEMFHCAACNIFLSTSASSVQTHITSQEHLSNTKEFEVQQRSACLRKAETMMKELKPQFEHFLKGGSPFE